MTKRALAATCALLLGSGACGEDDEGAGKVRVQLNAEESITLGLRPGAAEGATRDCSVTYTKYLVAIGDVALGRTASGATRALPTLFVADMLLVGEQGVLLGELDDLATGQWDQFSFATPIASALAVPLAGVLPEDVERMKAGGLTYAIEGRVECQARSVTFTFELAAPTRYSRCENDGEPGIAIAEGGTSSATVTLHGDHLWFNSLLAGEEITVERRAAWILGADQNADGHVSTAELGLLRAEQAFPRAEYDISSANIANAFDFVKAQLSTQGHLNQEGDCVASPL